jgi:hypothetical protein
MYPILMIHYCVFCVKIMTRKILDVVDLLVSLKLSFKSLFINLFFKLLKVGLFVGDFHIPQSLTFLFLQLFAIFVNLNSLLVESLLL